MKTTILIYCLLISLSFGQWSTNGVWPSYSYPRQAKAQFSEVYSAAVERCWAAGVSIAGPKWYVYQYDNMTNLKSRMAAAIPNYIVTNGYGGDLSSIIETGGLRHYTVTGLLASAKMPINFFSYTPRSNLSGCGPFTNAGLAWGNGWTNDQTAAGGTNYPTGRTNWYTTDYGLMHITNIFPPLVWTTPDLDCVVTSQWINGGGSPVTNQSEFDILYQNMLDLATNWPGAYVDVQVGSLADWSYLIGQASASKWLNYDVILDLHTGIGSIYPASTNRPNVRGDADFYAKNGAFLWTVDFGNNIQTNRVFDSFDNAKVTNQWIRVDQLSDVPATNFSYSYGSTNFPVRFCDSLTTTNSESLRGWALTPFFLYEGEPEYNGGFLAVLKFDGTNGFRYK